MSDSYRPSFSAVSSWCVAILAVVPTLFATTYVVPPDEVLIRKAGAVVIARALHSHVEESSERGIETVTVFAVEDALKDDGSVDRGLRVRVPGGAIVDAATKQQKFKVIPGAPRFVDGDRVLLFVTKNATGDYYVLTDFALGMFGFGTDDLGHRVILRAETEIHGWNLDGSVHHEPRRDADRFLAFIRDVAGHRSATNDYTIETSPIVGQSRSLLATNERRAQPLTCIGCTITQYTLSFNQVGVAPCNSGNSASDISCVENGPAGRWTTFPGAVNWNRGNTETNAGNGGSDAINAAFSAWNGDAGSNVNYLLTSTNANLNGITDPADTVNNIVFEHNFGSDFSCLGGGLLGAGGLSDASGVINTVNGESFFTNQEGDVSMNKGVGVCIGAGLTVGNFTSALTHELGHTLGFRHADKTRENSQSCTIFGSYDCATSAIMMAVVTNGLGGALQTWDINAVRAVYPGVAVPAAASISATATSSTSVSVTWSAVATATSYDVYRDAGGGFAFRVNTPTPGYTDSPVIANNAYLYKVVAKNAGGSSPDSNRDLATTVIFSNDPLTAGTVQAIHLTELRTAVNAVRTLAVQGTFSFTDASPAGVPIQSIHITQLRTNLDGALSAPALALPTSAYTNSASAGTMIRAIDFQEIRNRVK